MQFQNQNMLWALFLVLVPIIIHLFNFRKYKTLYFSNVSLLQNIKKETKKRAELKNLLLLISRILAVVFLVLAFAQPFFSVDKGSLKTKKTIVAVYIDNSFSMEATETYGVLLEQAKMLALDIAKSYPHGTHFLLTTNRFEQKQMQLVGQKQFVKWVSQIRASHSIKTIKQVQEKQASILLEQDSSAEIHQYLISDFQENIFDQDFYLDHKKIHTTLIPLTNQQNANVYIDSVWFVSPGHFVGKQERLKLKIVNYSNTDVQNLPVNLWINDSLKNLLSVDIPANENKIFEMNFVQNKAGIGTAKVELSDYPITFDNTLYFSFFINEKIRILELYEKKSTPYMASLFVKDKTYDFKKTELLNIDYQYLKQADVIIMNEIKKWESGWIRSLEEIVKSGKNIVIIPPFGVDVKDYNKDVSIFLKAQMINWRQEEGQMQDLNFDHLYFKNSIQASKEKMRLPNYKGFYAMKTFGRSLSSSLLKSESGYPLVLQQPLKKGVVTFFSFPLSGENTDFSTHPIFVPLFYNLALYSKKFNPIYHLLNQKMNIVSDKITGSEAVKLSNEKNDFEIIPEIIQTNDKVKLKINENQLIAGNFVLKTGTVPVDVFSFNYDRKESKSISTDLKKLKEYAKKSPNKNVDIFDKDKKNRTQEIQKQHKIKSFVLLFLIFTILMLFAEMLIARLMKN